MAEFVYKNPEVTSIVGLVETFVRHRDLTGPDRGYEIYHPSAFGKCLRKMQYQRYEARKLIHAEKEHFDGRMLRLFENGHVMHERWKQYFEDMNVLKGVWECKNPVCHMWDSNGAFGTPGTREASECYEDKNASPRVYGREELQGIFKPEKCCCGCKEFKYHEVAVVCPQLNFKGNADIILDFSRFDPSMFDKAKEKGLSLLFDPNDLPKGTVVVDMKTISTKSFENTVQKVGAHKYYQIQLIIYINVLKCDFGLLMYEEKDQFNLASFQIDKNPEWWEQIRKQAMLMQEMASGEKPLLPPPRPLTKTSYECKDCEFKKFCHKAKGIWDDPNLDKKRKDFYGDLL